MAYAQKIGAMDKGGIPSLMMFKVWSVVFVFVHPAVRYTVPCLLLQGVDSYSQGRIGWQ